MLTGTPSFLSNKPTGLIIVQAKLTNSMSAWDVALMATTSLSIFTMIALKFGYTGDIRYLSGAHAHIFLFFSTHKISRSIVHSRNPPSFGYPSNILLIISQHHQYEFR